MSGNVAARGKGVRSREVDVKTKVQWLLPVTELTCPYVRAGFRTMALVPCPARLREEEGLNKSPWTGANQCAEAWRFR